MKIIHKFVRLVRPPESTRIDLATRLPDKPLPTPIWQLAFHVIILSPSGSSFSAGNSLPLLMIPYREPLAASLCYRYLAVLLSAGSLLPLLMLSYRKPLSISLLHRSSQTVGQLFNQPFTTGQSHRQPIARYHNREKVNRFPLVTRTASQSPATAYQYLTRSFCYSPANCKQFNCQPARPPTPSLPAANPSQIIAYACVRLRRRCS